MKKVKKETKGKAVPGGFEENQVDAYHRWLKRGSPEGDSLTDWLAAEKQRRSVEEEAWEGEERRWEDKNPRDDEPGEAS